MITVRAIRLPRDTWSMRILLILAKINRPQEERYWDVMSRREMRDERVGVHMNLKQQELLTSLPRLPLMYFVIRFGRNLDHSIH